MVLALDEDLPIPHLLDERLVRQVLSIARRVKPPQSAFVFAFLFQIPVGTADHL